VSIGNAAEREDHSLRQWAILDFATATVAKLRDAFAAGGLSASAIVRGYLKRPGATVIPRA
jgi:hypothetical protein